MPGQNLDRIDKIARIVEVDCTLGDYTVDSKDHNCRAIMSDTGGEIAVDMYDPWTNTTATHVLSLPGQMWVQYGNITKIYRYYVGTTATTSQIYNPAGSLVNGLKLGW